MNTEKMTPKELAYAALDLIMEEENEGTWDQSDWSTCFASFVCMVADNVPDWEVDMGVYAATLLDLDVPVDPYGNREPAEIPMFSEGIEDTQDLEAAIVAEFGVRDAA